MLNRSFLWLIGLYVIFIPFCSSLFLTFLSECVVCENQVLFFEAKN